MLKWRQLDIQTKVLEFGDLLEYGDLRQHVSNDTNVQLLHYYFTLLCPLIIDHIGSEMKKSLTYRWADPGCLFVLPIAAYFPK